MSGEWVSSTSMIARESIGSHLSRHEVAHHRRLLGHAPPIVGRGLYSGVWLGVGASHRVWLVLPAFLPALSATRAVSVVSRIALLAPVARRATTLTARVVSPLSNSTVAGPPIA